MVSVAEGPGGLATNGAGPSCVLLLGSGGREHAIALKLTESPRVSKVLVAPGNGGTATCHSKIENVAVASDDESRLLELARSKGVSLVVVGPEAPLAAGVSDAFAAVDIPCFGPSKAAAQLEASKAFSKDFMARHGIPTAKYGNFTDYEKAKEFVQKADFNVVIKASGIAAGKGVLLPQSKEEALEGLKQMMVDRAFGSAGDEVVIEELLIGEEVSVLAFADGKNVALMPGAQDHKRALDGDEGLNTGGMGAYAPAPILTPELAKQLEDLLQRTVDGMAAEGSPYQGVLYGGFMITKEGPLVLEYNCRFGDPETQVLLPLLDSDLFDIMLSCVQGRLSSADVKWKSGAAATVVMAAKGYPESYPKGMPITGLESAKALGSHTTVYHAGTKLDTASGQIVANGGRVLAVTGRGKDIAEALQRAYKGVATVQFNPSHYRRDIGHRALKRTKVLLLGSGGREHAIVHKLAESPKVAHVFVAPGNGGTATFGCKVTNVAISSEDLPKLLEFVKQEQVGLVVVGPEAPLVIGAKDAFVAEGIPCFGPSKAAAQLEASKAFSKDFMARHGLPTAKYGNFKDYEKAKKFVEEADFNVVIKASGIAAGKGVLLPETKEEALAGLKQVMVDRAFGSAGDEVVVEELLIGEEVSVLAFADGKTVVLMPAAQDHKRALDGDQGLNTGGMGAYVPAPVYTPELKAQIQGIMQKTLDGMASKGTPYEGVLYGGFMITKDGPLVLEYNCRFGDPETQVLLPMLDSDLLDVMSACTEGKLAGLDVQWKSGAAATVVMAAKGYPESYPKGMPITGLDKATALGANVMVYHAGTKLNSASEQVVANGGRVLAVTGRGRDIPEALKRAYEGVHAVHFDPSHFRTDIGYRALKRPLRLGVLGSTRGTCMQAVIDAVESGQLDAQIVQVVSNKAEAGILERARRHNLPAASVSARGKSREEFDAEVTSLLEAAGVELVLLIGYMRIVSASFCRRWEDRCLNVHPSLLPDFAGGMDLEVHSAVIKAGKKESGCTVHFVTEQVDGGPIVVQERVPVEPQDTPESLKAKVQAKEGVAFLKAIEMFASGEVGPRSALKNC